MAGCQGVAGSDPVSPTEKPPLMRKRGSEAVSVSSWNREATTSWCERPPRKPEPSPRGPLRRWSTRYSPLRTRFDSRRRSARYVSLSYWVVCSVARTVAGNEMWARSDYREEGSATRSSASASGSRAGSEPLEELDECLGLVEMRHVSGVLEPADLSGRRVQKWRSDTAGGATWSCAPCTITMGTVLRGSTLSRSSWASSPLRAAILLPTVIDWPAWLRRTTTCSS
jgi:hypothetical protein